MYVRNGYNTTTNVDDKKLFHFKMKFAYHSLVL